MNWPNDIISKADFCNKIGTNRTCPAASNDVRFWEWSGKRLLAASISPFDPKRDIGDPSQ
jgi:hypothetical protein